MPKLVNKEEKKRDIALKALAVFAEHGLQKTSVDQVAKAAGVGKGTIYLYFSTKEEIVLEIWNSLLEHQDAWRESQLQVCESEFEKILAYYDFTHFEQGNLDHAFSLYADFIASSVTQVSPPFQDYCQAKHGEELVWIKERLDAGVASGEFRPVDTGAFAQVITYVHNGILVSSLERGLGIANVIAALPVMLTTLLEPIKTQGNT